MIIVVQKKRQFAIGGSADMQSVVDIVQGSAASFPIYLRDEDGNPITLTGFTSGNIVFRNAAGVRTVIALTIPGSNPDSGKIMVNLTPTNTASADKKWQSADLQLFVSSVMTLFPLTNQFNIILPNVPAS